MGYNGKTELEVITYRIGLADHSERQRMEKKWHSLRKLLAGNLDELGLMATQERFTAGDDDKYPANSGHTQSPRENIEVYDIQEGRMNMVQRVIKSLVQQIALQLPTFEFEGLKSDDTLLHRLYFEQTWGPPPFGGDAVSVWTQAIWDMLTCGVGFPGNTIIDGVPMPHRYDPVNVIWDESGSKIEDMQWVVIFESRRASEWAEIYGKEHFEEYLETNRTVELCFYYDVCGESGTSAVFATSNRKPVSPETPIDYTVSPFWIDLEVTPETTKRVVFLPCTPLTYLMPSGHATPIGLVEILAAPQQFLLRAYALLQRQMSMPPSRLVNMSGLADETKKQLATGIVPDVWQVTGNKELDQVMRILGAPPLDANMLTALDRIEKFFVEASDENPYSGGVSQDVEFAAEVQQIQNQSGRGVSYLSKKAARSMEAIAQRHLWLAVEFDDQPRVIQFRNLRLTFDQNNPIGEYLDPHARPIVREDTMRYASREQKIAQARTMLQDLAPFGMAQLALEELLRAYGVDDPGAFATGSQEGSGDMMTQAPGMMPEAQAM